MELQDLIFRFSQDTEHRQKAVFSSLFILTNRLQTLFDSRIPDLSLKQFMVLSVARQAEEPMTLTQLGRLLGCSRQNVKKLAEALEKKGFVRLERGPRDPRAVCLRPTPRAEAYFQQEFSPYQAQLSTLFSVYTPEETAQLFRLLSRLYEGVDRLEQEGLS